MLELLLETHGLERLMYQNDINELTVLRLLEHEGLINPYDYMFEDVEDE